MRLFVAIELDETVRRAAAKLIARLERRAATLAPKARIGWITPERMHLTVRFIGYVDDETFARIGHALEPALHVAPFTLQIEGVGTFPSKGAPRVIWAGVRDESGAVADVEREVTARLETLGIPPEDRPYAPHLTLARVREPAGLKAAPLLDRLGPARLGSNRISAVTLFESRLSPKGPTYLPLQRTMLASA